jgi:NAD(P)-dependent dehydrogenase (short-subunit alcohol dehydrogenase family)
MKMELGQLGIRVVHVSPGYMKTGFFDNFPEGYQIPRNAPSPDMVAKGVVKMLERLPATGEVREVIRNAKRRLFN